jgi:AbrB family looped-hinge helix DNA binding protein
MKNAVSTVTTKGQLVIPAKLRRKYGIRKGTRVAMIEEENLPANLSAACADRSKGNRRRLYS